MRNPQTICVTIELSPAQAAGLLRLVEKTGPLEARAVLYPHLRQEIRDAQAADIVSALGKIERTLKEAGVSSFPWISTGGS